DGADAALQSAQPSRVACDDLERLHWRKAGLPRQIDAVPHVAEFGIKRSSVTAESHALHQSHLIKRVDYSQEALEVPFELGELVLLGGGKSLAHGLLLSKDD